MDDNRQQLTSWMRQLVDGDDLVVAEFWKLYGDRLQRLAAKNLTTRLQCRVGPDDIVQSACRTFFRRAQEGEFQLSDSESLWRLLCVITLTKVRGHARFHLRKKRSVAREHHLDANVPEASQPPCQLAANDPTPDEAIEFAEQFEQLLAGMDEEEQQLVQLKLDQYTNVEIAERLGCSERTVRRILKRVRSRLRALLDQ